MKHFKFGLCDEYTVFCNQVSHILSLESSDNTWFMELYMFNGMELDQTFSCKEDAQDKLDEIMRLMSAS